MTPSFHRKLLFAAATALTLLAGCGHYQLGSTISENLRDVYVPNVRNESGQPGVEIALTQALIKEIQREGTLRIVPEERAGSRLDVVVVSNDSMNHVFANTILLGNLSRKMMVRALNLMRNRFPNIMQDTGFFDNIHICPNFSGQKRRNISYLH